MTLPIPPHSDRSTIRMSATKVDPPAGRPQMTGQMVPHVLPHGSMAPHYEAQKGGKPGLYSGNMRVNTRSKQLKDVKIDQRTQTIYKLTHEFIVKHHSAEFPHEEPKELLAKVVACEAMIYALFGQIHFRLDQAKEELEKTPPLPAERYKALKKDQEELEELLQKLRSIDREAIYETVASWNKLDTDPSKPNVLSKLKEATHQVSVKSKRSMQEHKIAHYAKQHWIRNSWFGNNPIGKWLGIYHYQPEEAAVHEYALDRGDLLLPDKEEEYARAKETDRIQKQSSVERFVVNLMISLLSPTKNKYTHLMDPGFECPVLAGISSPIKTAILHDLETSDDQHFSKAYAKKAVLIGLLIPAK